MNKLGQSFVITLEYLESIGLEPHSIPLIVQGCIALAEEFPELVHPRISGTLPMPSIVQLLGLGLTPEWDWSKKAALDLKKSGYSRVLVEVIDMTAPVSGYDVDIDDDRDWSIEIATSRNSIAHTYLVEQITEETARLISSVIEMCLEFHKISVEINPNNLSLTPG